MQNHLIPIFNDNYVFMLENGSEAIAIDPGTAAPVLEFLKKKNLELQAILITHHHPDHTGGISDLKSYYPRARVYGPCSLAQADYGVEEGDQISLLQNTFEVWELPGHTLDHIAFYSSPWLFSGDVLFSAGCGRLFEGTAAQMWESLQRIKNISDAKTMICCTHEYTLNNLKWLREVLLWKNEDVENYFLKVKDLRAQNKPTVPLNLDEQIKINPFLNADDNEIKSCLKNLNLLNDAQLAQASSLEIFTILRKLRNNF